jgi:alkanesulfonate monooxygenase SsuD/methylene tetrahydromethanopterin reductase-like flavin-dependent oxidoreductase (luciferase family)
MWTEKKASFEGNYYTIKEAICNPKPIHKPYPVIMVGGEGEISFKGGSKAYVSLALLI